MVSQSVEEVQKLLVRSDASVSIDAVRKVYKEQEWNENASLDLKQFSILWTATVGDKDVMPVQLREDSVVAEKIAESSGGHIGSRVESVFCNAAVGGAKGQLDSPGVEGVQILLAGSDISVSLEAIRKVYKGREWDEKSSLDLKQFTTLWTATIGDEGLENVHQHEEVLSATIPWPGDATQQENHSSVADSTDESQTLEHQSMEVQVQKRLVQMWEDGLVQVPEEIKATLPTTAFDSFAEKNRANVRAYIAAAGKKKSMEDRVEKHVGHYDEGNTRKCQKRTGIVFI